MNTVATFCICLIIAINGDEFTRRLLQTDQVTDACAAATCPACTQCIARGKRVKCKAVRGCCTSDDDCKGRQVCINQKCSRKKKCEQCGGIQGLQCSSGLTCVDDPTDSCDPSNGGADCSGCCTQCPAIRCSNPCEPCGTMPAGTTCKTEPGTLSNGCPGCPVLVGCPVGSCKSCGGFAGTPCDAGFTCKDNPFDSCDPTKGGADCPGCCQIDNPSPCPLPSCLNPCDGKCKDTEECVTHTFFNPNTGCSGCPEFIECVPKSTGKCPTTTGFGTCAEECPPTGCTNGTLCCSNGCGHVCMNPVQQEDEQSVLMHIGKNYADQYNNDRFVGKWKDNMFRMGIMGGLILILIFGLILNKCCCSSVDKLSDERSPLLVNMQTKN